MRNNPKYKDTVNKDKVLDFIRKEKCVRLLNVKRAKFLNIFANSLKKNVRECSLPDLEVVASEIDKIYEFKGKLKEYLVTPFFIIIKFLYLLTFNR